MGTVERRSRGGRNETKRTDALDIAPLARPAPATQSRAPAVALLAHPERAAVEAAAPARPALRVDSRRRDGVATGAHLRVVDEGPRHASAARPVERRQEADRPRARTLRAESAVVGHEAAAPAPGGPADGDVHTLHLRAAAAKGAAAQAVAPAPQPRRRRDADAGARRAAAAATAGRGLAGAAGQVHRQRP